MILSHVLIQDEYCLMRSFRMNIMRFLFYWVCLIRGKDDIISRP